MNIQHAVLGGVLLAVLVMPAFSQSSGSQGNSGQDITQPRIAKGPPGGFHPPLAQQAIMDVQAKLKDKGYFKDNVDGNWSPTSTTALLQYQKDHGLQPSGVLDRDTAAALGLSLAEFSAFEAAMSQQPGAHPQSPDLHPQAPDPIHGDDSVKF